MITGLFGSVSGARETNRKRKKKINKEALQQDKHCKII